MVAMPVRELSLQALTAAFSAGQLGREAYWTAMKEHHRSLQEYAERVRLCELDRIEIRGDGVDVVFRSGLRMVWDPEDMRSVPSAIVNHGRYEPDETRILSALAGKARVVLDVGANAGFMALHMAHAGAGVVHAFEPVPHTFDVLLRNVRNNQMESRIVCHSLALGDHAGTVRFHIPELHGSVAASSLPLFPDQANVVVSVTMVRLDDFVAENKIVNVDMVKCDVEGGELFALQGALETLRRDHPILMLELLRKWSSIHGYHPNQVLQLLAPLGYQAFALGGGVLRPTQEITADTEETNFLFLQAHHVAWAVRVIEELLWVQRDSERMGRTR